MIKFSKKDISKMGKTYRLNLINSCTGYKSANLIGTISTEGNNNLAVFSSITHIGSNPSILGFILRSSKRPRDTYINIKNTNEFSVNHIHFSQIDDAHNTSKKFPAKISEFDKTNLTEEYKKNWKVPFVKNSPVQIGCKYLNEYKIKENSTLLIVASIEEIFVKDEIIYDDGLIQLDKGGVTSINGLDTYTLPKYLKRIPYLKKI
tara:strand:- start:1705 stop:2319 length:615 start_codon:yes stop_codon:yes gene_type:complete